MSSYQAKHRNYYFNHKDAILEKERTKKRWLTYYEHHKDAIKERREARKRGTLPGREVPREAIEDEGEPITSHTVLEIMGAFYG